MALSIPPLLTTLQAGLSQRLLLGLSLALVGLACLDQLSPQLLQLTTFGLPVALAAAFATPRQVGGLAALALALGLWAELHRSTGFSPDLGVRLLIFAAITVVAFWMARRRRSAGEASPTADRMGAKFPMVAADTKEAPASGPQAFRVLSDNSRDGVLILEVATGLITMANQSISELLGYAKDELVGRHLWELEAFQDSQAAFHTYAELLEKGCLRQDGMPLLHKDGNVVEVELEGTLYRPGRHDVIQCHIRRIPGRNVAVPEVPARRYQQDVMRSLAEIVAALVMLNEQRDPYTAGHEARVSELSVAIGQEMGLKPHDLEGLRISGLLHDLGKFTIPVEILTKPGRVTAEEMALIRTHVQSGFEVLKGIHFPWPVAEIVLQHHERLDGSGYPHQLKGDQIGPMARILAVADTVESMSTDRPYRFSPGLDMALEAIEAGKGRIYDADVVEACLRVFRERGFVLPKRKLEPSWSMVPGDLTTTSTPLLPEMAPPG